MKADVNPLDRLQSVRGSNSVYYGEKYRPCTRRARRPRDLELAFDESLVDDHLGRDCAQLRLALAWVVNVVDSDIEWIQRLEHTRTR